MTAIETHPRYYGMNPHDAVYLACKAGELVRPETCSQCGGTGRIEGHHKDYSKPLDVTWLCRRCHALEHGKISRGEIAAPLNR